MKSKPLHLLIVSLFLISHSVFAQTSTDAAKDVNFQISFGDGKSVYRIGESIIVNLSFSSSKGGYFLETINSTLIDDVIIAPKEGVYDWRYRLDRLDSLDDMVMRAELNTVPRNLSITLNNVVRFDKPGKYCVTVLSKRLAFDKEEYVSLPNRVTLLSNTINFEIKAMTDEEEAVEIQRLRGRPPYPTSSRNISGDGYSSDISYLTGDISTREKVRNFLSSQRNINNIWYFGLYIARNKPLVINLLEEALRDPNREIDSTFLHYLSSLRILREDELNPDTEPDWMKLSKERSKRITEIQNGYIAELIESLPKRSLKNQIQTAYTIFTSLPYTDVSSPAFNLSRNILLANFDDISLAQKSELLSSSWRKFKSPSLSPSLEKILADKEPSEYSRGRSVAFERLVELDQARARPLVIEEIQNPDINVYSGPLLKLNDKFLPEVDDALLKQIRALAPDKEFAVRGLRIRDRISLAARYATAKIYKDLLEIYKKYNANWTPDTSILFLEYIARHNEKEALPLFEEKLLTSKEVSVQRAFIRIAEANFTEGKKKIVQQGLESDNPQIAREALAFLIKHGSKENRKLIEKRLNRWMLEWSIRRDELNDPKGDYQIQFQAGLQGELIAALISNTHWKLTETQIYQLKLTCITERCRQMLSIRPKNPTTQS